MKLDEVRFRKFLSELGLNLSPGFRSSLRLFQGTTDVISHGEDILEIREGVIHRSVLIPGSPKLTIAELEVLMALSEKIKKERFTSLELHISLTLEKITKLNAFDLTSIPKVGPQSKELVGLPASPGKIRSLCIVLPTKESISGKIIVLKNSRDLQTLLMEKPSGIILEEGNLLSHASILAREAKIPAIVKVQNATKKIKTGEMVEINAGSGVITILKA